MFIDDNILEIKKVKYSIKDISTIHFDEPNIKFIVGDVNDEKIKHQIIQHSKFDIIIDDGSHQSDDIIKTFCNYFKHLKHEGVYIIEDLHCSYQREYMGGLFFPISSINFFKKLVDIINHEHWGIEKKKEWFLRGFVENYKIQSLGPTESVPIKILNDFIANLLNNNLIIFKKNYNMIMFRR